MKNPTSASEILSHVSIMSRSYKSDSGQTTRDSIFMDSKKKERDEEKVFEKTLLLEQNRLAQMHTSKDEKADLGQADHLANLVSNSNRLARSNS